MAEPDAGDSLLTIIYVSAAREPMSDAQLENLLRVAQARNARLGITGLLLYRDGNFMQLLEGPEAAVKEVFRAIEQDPRHHMVTRILDESGLPREFAGWSMAFGRPDDSAWNALMASLQPEGESASPDIAKELLHAFWTSRF